MPLKLRPRWMDDPAVTLPCQEPDVDPDVFHPVACGEAGKKAVLVAAAYCNRCDRREDCLLFGLTSSEAGIWGGRNLSDMSVKAKRDLEAELRKRRGAA